MFHVVLETQVLPEAYSIILTISCTLLTLLMTQLFLYKPTLIHAHYYFSVVSTLYNHKMENYNVV